MMKQFFTALFSFVLLVSMIACSSPDRTITSGAPSSQPESRSDVTFDGSASGPPSGSESRTEGNSVPAESSTEEPADGSLLDTEEKSGILVACFSWAGNAALPEGVDAIASASVDLEDGSGMGNAQYLASIAQEVTGGDLFFIETTEKYPAAYRETTDRAKAEQNENARPELASHLDNMDEYHTVILVYPNWWGTLPQAVFTFLEEYDFTGKTIWPLCTHEGSRLGRSESDLTQLVPAAQIEKGLAVRGGSVGDARADVEAWLEDLKRQEGTL